MKSLGRLVGFTLLVSYPILLTIVGLEYGGLAFWGGLAGSAAAIGIILARLGYAKNFQAWNPRLIRQLANLSLAFIITVGFYLSLFWLKAGATPIIFGVLLGILALALVRRERS